MDIEKVKRYSLVEICLLAIFMLGIFVASMIVKARSRVILSELITVPGSGLSVALPTGPGWEQTPEWQYEEAENSMALIAQFGDPDRGGIAVRWRYAFSSPNASERELLEQKAQQISAAIQEIAKTDQGQSMVYAKLVLPQTPHEFVYMGMLRLDSGRLLELLVKSYSSSDFYVENVFKSTAASIQYHPLQESADGRTLLGTFLAEHKRRPLSDEAFLIKNALGTNTGYYYARYLASEEKKRPFGVQIHQFEFNSLKLVSELSFDPAGNDILWKAGLTNPRIRGTINYTISGNENGDVSISRNDKTLKTFPAEHIFLPEPLLGDFAHAFLESEHSRVIIDILAVRGQLVPVRLTKLPPDKVQVKSENAGAAVRIDFLYHPDSYEELLFDDSGKLLGKSEKQPGRRIRLWDVVSTDILQQIFPDNFDKNADINLLEKNNNGEQYI